MTIRDILIFLFKWKRVICFTFLFILLLTTVLTYLIPPSYVAQASVLVERNRAPAMRSSFVSGMEAAEVLNTEVQIALSHTVIAAAVDKVAPHLRPKGSSVARRIINGIRGMMSASGLVPEISPRQRWIRSLMSSVKAEPVTVSSILRISFENPDPQLATQIVNTITDEYIKHHLKVYSALGSSEFYKSRMEQSEKTLDQLRQKRRAMQKEFPTVAIKEQKSALVGQLADLHVDLIRKRNELVQLQQTYSPGHEKIRTVERQLKELNNRIEDTEQELARLDVQQEDLRQVDMLIGNQEEILLEQRKRFEEDRMNELANTSMVNVRLVEYASVPSRPRYSRLFLIFIAAAGGLVMAVMLALVLEYFDHRVEEPDDAESALGVPVVGSVNRLSRQEIRALASPNSPPAQS